MCKSPASERLPLVAAVDEHLWAPRSHRQAFRSAEVALSVLIRRVTPLVPEELFLPVEGCLLVGVFGADPAVADQ